MFVVRSFIRPGCSIGKLDFPTYYFFSLLLVLVFTLFVVAAAAVYTFVLKKGHRMRRGLVIAGHVTYLQLTMLTFRVLNCQKGGDEDLFLVAEPARTCFEGAHTSSFAAALVVLIVICVGLPVFYFRKLQAKGRDTGRWKEEKFFEKWGFLYTGCRPAVWWYRLLNYLISFVLALCAIFASDNLNVLIACAFVVFVCQVVRPLFMCSLSF